MGQRRLQVILQPHTVRTGRDAGWGVGVGSTRHTECSIPTTRLALAFWFRPASSYLWAAGVMVYPWRVPSSARSWMTKLENTGTGKCLPPLPLPSSLLLTLCLLVPRVLTSPTGNSSYF